MKFIEVRDFNDIVNEKFVWDWEQLDDFPFFKDLRETLDFTSEGLDGEDCAEVKALAIMQRSIFGWGAVRLLKNFFSEEIMEEEIDALLERNQFLLEDEAAALDMPFEKFLDEKNLNDKDEQLYYLIRKTAEDIKELFDAKKLFFKKSHFNEYEREKFYDDLVLYCNGKDDLKDFFKYADFNNSGDVMENFEKYIADRLSIQDIEELIEKYWDTTIGKDCDTTIEEYDDFIETQSGGDLIEKVNAANTFRRFVALPNAVAYLAKICYDEDYAREELEYHKVESYTDEEQRDAEAHGEYDDIRSTDLDKPKKKGKKQ